MISTFQSTESEFKIAVAKSLYQQPYEVVNSPVTLDRLLRALDFDRGSSIQWCIKADGEFFSFDVFTKETYDFGIFWKFTKDDGFAATHLDQSEKTLKSFIEILNPSK